MQSTRCVFSSSRALKRVFLLQLDARAPMAAAASLSIRQTYLLPRLFSTSIPRQRLVGAQRKPKVDTRRALDTPSALLRRPTDNAIPFKWVILKNADETLGEPQRKLDVLRDLDRSRYSLVMVAPPQKHAHKVKNKRLSTKETLEEEEDEAGGGAEVAAEEAEDPFTALLREQASTVSAPICQIVDRQALQAREEAIAKEARRKELNRKELELNWAIAPHDLQHKLKHLKEFLGKGKKVEVMLARKSGGRPAQKEEADETLRALKEAAESVRAREVKSTGRFPGLVRVVFEPSGHSGGGETKS